MISPSNLLRGSIWFFDLDPIIGHEQGKKRPCLIISTTMYNQGRSGLVVVLPITSKARELYWQVALNEHETNLPQLSYVICDQIRSISCMRASGRCLGMLTDERMEQIEERVRNLLSLFL